MSNEQMITELKLKKKDIVESFNQIALNMVSHLGNEFKNSIFGKNATLIKNFFKFKPNEIIVLFLDNIYSNDEYRKQIKAGNDSFFMEQSYDNAKKIMPELKEEKKELNNRCIYLMESVYLEMTYHYLWLL